MAQSFLGQYIGDLEQQDVLFGNEKFVIVDAENGKLIPLTVLVEYLDEANSYKPGDVVSIDANTIMAGIISGSSKTISFAIPLGKEVTATSLLFECNDLTVRGPGGYLMTDKPVSDYTVAYKIKNNFVSIFVTSSTAFNATNNTSVSVEGTMKITFK